MSSAAYFPATSRVYNFCDEIVRNKDRALLTKTTAVALGAIACILTFIIDLVTYPPRYYLQSKYSPEIPEKQFSKKPDDFPEEKKIDPSWVDPIPFSVENIKENSAEVYKILNQQMNCIKLYNFSQKEPKLLEFQTSTATLIVCNYSNYTLKMDDSGKLYVNDDYLETYKTSDSPITLYQASEPNKLIVLTKIDKFYSGSVNFTLQDSRWISENISSLLDISPLANAVSLPNIEKEKKKSRTLKGQMDYVETHKNSSNPRLSQFQTSNTTFTVCNYSQYPLEMTLAGMLFVDRHTLPINRKLSGSFITLFPIINSSDDPPRLGMLENKKPSKSLFLQFVLNEGSWNKEKTETIYTLQG